MSTGLRTFAPASNQPLLESDRTERDNAVSQLRREALAAAQTIERSTVTFGWPPGTTLANRLGGLEDGILDRTFGREVFVALHRDWCADSLLDRCADLVDTNEITSFDLDRVADFHPAGRLGCLPVDTHLAFGARGRGG